MDQDWLDTEIKLESFTRILVNIAVVSAAASLRKGQENTGLPVRLALSDSDLVFEKVIQNMQLLKEKQGLIKDD